MVVIHTNDSAVRRLSLGLEGELVIESVAGETYCIATNELCRKLKTETHNLGATDSQYDLPWEKDWNWHLVYVDTESKKRRRIAASGKRNREPDPVYSLMTTAFLFLALDRHIIAIPRTELP